MDPRPHGWRPGATPEDELGWAPAPPRALASRPRRLNGNAVLLPTGEMLVVGGVSGVRQPNGKLATLDTTAVPWPEIYNPFTNEWSALTTPDEKAQVTRNYHSVALLMPDGRVWTAGSDFNAEPGIGSAEMRIEIYEPWYHGRPNRPEILAAPDRWATGEEVSVRTTHAEDIGRVAMVRCGSCTHGFNPDQRHVGLPWKRVGQTDELKVNIPTNGNIIPSGLYFLYTITRHGLPSAGTTVYVSTTPETDTERQWDELVHG